MGEVSDVESQSVEIDRVAEVLEDHQWSVGRGTCWCGWEPENALQARRSREGQFARHQAEQVIRPGADS